MTTKSIHLMKRQQVRDLAGKLMEEWQNLDAVAEALGCHPNNVRRWHEEYRQKESEPTPSVKEPGRPPKLTVNQQNIIQDIIFTKTPRDMNQQAVLWSNTVIQNTIRDLFRTRLTLGTVNALTAKMGIVRRPFFKHDHTHNTVEIADWLTDRFPFIRKLAKNQKARILFIHDEKIAACQPGGSFPGNGKGSNGGKKNARQFEMRMLSAICPRNSQRFMVFSGPFASQPFTDFLDGLMRDIEGPLFLIAEPHCKQIAMEADPFLASAMDCLSLFFLPEGRISRNERRHSGAAQ